MTFNLSDFPVTTLAGHGIEAIHPDVFVQGLVHGAPTEVAHAMRTMTSRWRRPQVALEQAIELFRTRWGPLPRAMKEMQEHIDAAEE